MLLLLGSTMWGLAGGKIGSYFVGKIGLLIVVVAVGGKWLLATFDIAVDILFYGARALYVRNERIVYISERWLSLCANQIASVDLEERNLKGRVFAFVRIRLSNGTMKVLPSGLTSESDEELVRAIIEFQKVDSVRRRVAPMEAQD
ncbi:MAG TPA: hypothetical protein VHI52_04555 [Verrucomicrobiae bacterium]|nr:hypothetical protein [Verrucomicrobiae bacterium]